MKAQPKIKTFRSKKYLDFVRSKPCCICGSRWLIAAHHTEGGSVGMKGSDISAVPLCYLHHAEIHQTRRKDAIPGLTEIIQGLREEWERKSI